MVRSRHAQGYFRVYVRGVNKKDKRLLEHRFVYEQYHKCCLLSWVQVHHINHDRLDNRIENLVAVSRRGHPSLHRKDMTNRKCAICNRISITYYRGSQVWYKYQSNGFLCKVCYDRTHSQSKR